MNSPLDPRIATLSPKAKDVGAQLFGMMRPGSESRLRLGMAVSRPKPSTQMALDEMAAAGLISVETDGRARIYRPLASFHPLMAEKMAMLLEGRLAEGEGLFEPISPAA